DASSSERCEDARGMEVHSIRIAGAEKYDRPAARRRRQGGCEHIFLQQQISGVDIHRIRTTGDAPRSKAAGLHPAAAKVVSALAIHVDLDDVSRQRALDGERVR